MTSDTDSTSPDELEYASRRYAAPRITYLPLSSGRIAIGEGFNPPELLHICEDWSEAAEYLAGFAEAYAAEDAARRARPSAQLSFDLTLDLDLSNLEISL